MEQTGVFVLVVEAHQLAFVQFKFVFELLDLEYVTLLLDLILKSLVFAQKTFSNDLLTDPRSEQLSHINL